MSPRPFVALLAVAAVAAGSLLSGCGRTEAATPKAQDSKAKGPPAVNVTVSPVKSMELQRSVRIVGSLVGLETATISNRVTGVVSKVYVDRGDRVKPNQPLLDIEPEQFELSEKVAEATLAQTLAKLGLKEVPAEDFDVNQTAPVKKAKSDYDLAKSKMDRATPLNQAKTLNDFEYLDMVSAFKSAESALEASRDEARSLVAMARQNQASIALRMKDSKDSHITAPAGMTPDGTKISSYAVTERKVSQGEYLREGTALFTLVADSVLKLQTRVPERYLADVKEGAQITFRVEAYPDETFVGKVHTIDPAVDPASRTFLIEALVDNSTYGNRLRPGSFVPGKVLTKVEQNRVMVPQESVTSFVGVTKVFKITSNNVAKAVNVVTGQEEVIKDASGHESRWVEIASGDVGPNDQVAVSGLTKLVDGSPVLIDSTRTKPEGATTQPTE